MFTARLQRRIVDKSFVGFKRSESIASDTRPNPSFWRWLAVKEKRAASLAEKNADRTIVTSIAVAATTQLNRSMPPSASPMLDVLNR
jgi:hypothetical protein